MLVCREAIKNDQQFNHSLGAFKIVIFAGGNSVSSFGFVGGSVGAWQKTKSK